MRKKRHTHTNQLNLLPGIEFKETDSHMVREFGMGPEGTKCLTCKYVENHQNDYGELKQWHKCEWDANDWDIKLDWQSCRKYESLG